MKLWNLHSRAFHSPSDETIPLCNEVFARKFAAQLISLGLSGNLLLHLINCWDLSVIDPQHILICMAILEDARERLEAANSTTNGGSNVGDTGDSDMQEAAAAAAADDDDNAMED
jgi:hypothetical protein